MPDPTLKTLSATESPALFGVSPYVTKWMLYQRFANGMDIDTPADARMNWGKKTTAACAAAVRRGLAV